MFRYSARRWSDLLLALGLLRIGTLHDFRRLEHVRGISDPGEGRKTVHTHVDDLLISHSDDPGARELEAFGAIKLPKGAMNVRITNMGFARTFDVPNCYVLCTSSSHSRKTMACFDGADSCVQVHKPKLFYALLTDAISAITPVRFVGAARCVYAARSEEWNKKDWGIHPALLKEKQHEDQQELRAIWEPADGRILRPIVTGNVRLLECCEGADI